MSESDSDGNADDIPKPRNEILIRSYERRQLVEFLPDVIEIYDQFDDESMREKLEIFETMLDTFDEEIDGDEATYNLGADQWRDLALALEELDNTRASWLRAKIGRRAELPSVHMGFTTTVPFMTIATGKDPVHPDRS